MYRIIEYNADGLPKCEICGKYFARVVSHVRQAHQMTEKEYKTAFCFDLTKGICSQESSAKSREIVFKNYDKCVNKNLLIKGESTRMKPGGKGRTKDKVSEQTRIRLRERLREPKMQEILRESGRKVGKTGTGNAKRWEK